MMQILQQNGKEASLVNNCLKGISNCHQQDEVDERKIKAVPFDYRVSIIL